MLVHQIRSVWVPFWVNPHNEEIANVANEVPRFLHPEECKDFIQLNQRRLSRRKIQFQERFEDEFKHEFARGVGRDRKWKYGPVYGPEVPLDRRSLRDYD